MKPIPIILGTLVLAAIIGTYSSNPQMGGTVIVIGIIAAVVSSKSESGKNRNHRQSGGQGPVSQPRGNVPRTKTAADGPKGRKPKPCRHHTIEKGLLVPHFPYCVCKSPGRLKQGDRKKPRYGFTDDGYPRMGVADNRTTDAWFKLCVHGIDENDDNVTPSKCKFYR